MLILTDKIKTRSPFKDLFTIKSSTLSAITKSMKKDGFNEAEPLVYWHVKNVGNVLVDGHTRLEAARQAGLGGVHAIGMDFDSELKAVEYAISRQKNRRNLTDGEMLSCLNELDKLRSSNMGRGDKVAQHCATLDKGKSSKQTAETLGISARKVEQARTVQDHADEETVQAVKDGNMSINKAYNETQERRKAEAEPKEEEQDEQERGIILNDYATQIVKQLKSKGCTSEEIAYVFSIATY